LLKKYSKELGVTQDKVQFDKEHKGVIEIKPGTSIKKMTKFIGMDKMDMTNPEARRIKKLVLGQSNPIEAAIAICDNPETPLWIKRAAWNLALKGIDPMSILVKKMIISSPFAPTGMKKMCAVCSELTDLQCSVCKSVYYCSKACAKKDREIHRKDCKV
jgi:hypothetical protein